MAEGKVDLWEINPLRTVDGECMICSGEGHGYGLIATVLDESDAKKIITAVNTYPAVEGLVKALEKARKRIEYLGNFGHERHSNANETEFFPQIDAALERFRSLQNGGAE
jgi:hypothetical protein